MDPRSPDNTGDRGCVAGKMEVYFRSPWLVLCVVVLSAIAVGGSIVAFKFLQKDSNAHIDIASIDKRVFQTSPAIASASVEVNNDTDDKSSVSVPKPLVVTIKAKDNLGRVFKRNGLSDKSAASIVALKKASALKNLKAGKKLVLALDPTRAKINELTYEIDPLNTIVVTATDNGWSVKTNHIEPTSTIKYTSAVIDRSIYTAGKQAGIPRKLIAQFVNVFSHRTNINKLSNGDRLAILYKEYTVGDKKVRDSEIIAAELVHKGKFDRVIGFADSHGGTNFYTPDGRSIKPSFIRYPINFKHVGSRFSQTRLHPILGTVRPHLGVDLAANTGTPIKATSNGKIAFSGFKGGYGRAIIVKNGIYSTLYAHLSRFASNVQAGKYVKQGQIIGYVGSSGLSTSAHLHYEFRVMGVHRDPMKVSLPAGEMIAAEHRGKFLAISRKMLAQLDLHRKDDKVFAMNRDTKFE